jgi:hemerythrin-like domain-containing protein
LIIADDAYAQFQWDHMRKEEDVVFPMAQRHLTEQDWKAIDDAFQANVDRAW